MGNKSNLDIMRAALLTFIDAVEQQMNGEEGKGDHRAQITVDDGVTSLSFGYGYFSRRRVLVQHRNYNPDGTSNRIIDGELTTEEAINLFIKRYEDNS